MRVGPIGSQRVYTHEGGRRENWDEGGVRYVLWPPWHSLWGNIAQFDPRFYDPAKRATIHPTAGHIVSGDPYNGIVLPGSGWPDAAKGRVNVADDASFNRLFKGLPEGLAPTHRNIYELPFFRDRSKLVSKMFGGWQVSGITEYRSGTPLSPGWRNEDIAGVGTGSGSQPWNLTGSPVLPGGQRGFSGGLTEQNFWFNRNVFVRPAAGTYGNAGRNTIYGPGFYNWDIGLAKRFHLDEDKYLQVRAEMYNFLNHPNWDNPNTDPTNAFFGRVTSKSGNRDVQISLQFRF